MATAAEATHMATAAEATATAVGSLGLVDQDWSKKQAACEGGDCNKTQFHDYISLNTRARPAIL
jgi:hypothetical protein